MSLKPYCPKCKKMLEPVYNRATGATDLVCDPCSGISLFVVQPEKAIWKLNGKIVQYEFIQNILAQKQISDEESQTTHFWGRKD